MTRLRWGILGARSKIASTAVEPALVASERNEVVARASRDADGSDRPYAELLARPDVDAVYIPVPNGLHHRWVVATVEAGKHVLCEKPLGLDEAEAAALFAAADGAGRTLLEAYMTPYHPRTRRLEALVADGVLGEIRAIEAAFTFPLLSDRPDDHRLDTLLGGGASLDVGIYCVAPMLWALGREPVAVDAAAVWHAHRADRTLSAFLDFGDGVTGSFTVSFECPPRQRLSIVGTAARIDTEWAFNPGDEPTALTVVYADGGEDIASFPGASAYLGMVDHVAAVILDGVPPRHGPSQTLAVARTLDRARAAAGG